MVIIKKNEVHEVMPIISTRHVLGIAAVVALVLFQQVLQEVTQYQVATTHYVQRGSFPRTTAARSPFRTVRTRFDANTIVASLRSSPASFTIWLNHGFLVVFLPLALLARCMRHCTERRADAKARAQPLVNEDAAEEEDEEGAALEAVESAVRSAKTCSLCALFNDAREREGWGTRTRVALRAVALAVLYLVPNVLWVYTLTQVTITMFMVITQSVCVFVLLFEAAMHRTFPHPLDLLAVAGVISGVIAIALAEEHKTSSANSVSGVVNCVVVSLGFALYEVYWTHSVGSDATRPALEAVFLMVGLVGAANVALLWPAFWTFDALRATSLVDGAALPGPFALPSSGEEWALSLRCARLLFPHAPTPPSLPPPQRTAAAATAPAILLFASILFVAHSFVVPRPPSFRVPPCFAAARRSLQYSTAASWAASPSPPRSSSASAPSSPFRSLS